MKHKLDLCMIRTQRTVYFSVQMSQFQQYFWADFITDFKSIITDFYVFPSPYFLNMQHQWMDNGHIKQFNIRYKICVKYEQNQYN